ncbi:MAG: hypothetical protein HRU41_38850 [Saprospiraceae bacterium]|nr:hypothetical protein [Saprospiraceae bacterium]
MKTYIELWKAKSTWLNLSMEERGNYMEKVGPAIQQFLDKGIEIISWGVVEAETHHKIDYDFFGIWMLPTVELAREFEAMVEAAGWYEYFEQVNAMGNHETPQDIIPKIINL